LGVKFVDIFIGVVLLIIGVDLVFNWVLENYVYFCGASVLASTCLLIKVMNNFYGLIGGGVFDF